MNGERIEHRLVDRSNIRFFVIGDFGTGDRFQSKVADAMAMVADRDPPDFVLSTGDCLYLVDDKYLGASSIATVLEERFEPYYARLGVDFFQCLGNHDVIDIFGGDPAPMIEYSKHSAVWRFPSLNYSVPNLPAWLAIQIINTTVFGFGGRYAEEPLYCQAGMAEQLDWVNTQFDNAQGLRILVGHHPVFTAGKRTFRYEGDGVVGYMRPLRKAIEESQVHFYFSGHEHHQSHIIGRGCEYIIQGCGGVGTRVNRKHRRREDGWYDAEKALRFFDVCNGFAVVDVNDALEVRVRFFGMALDEPPESMHEIYRFDWSPLSLDESLKFTSERTAQ